MADSVLKMVQELVSAQIKSGGIAPEQVSELLVTTHRELLSLQSREESDPSANGNQPLSDTPPNWKKSIAKHAVTCLECGVSFKQLSTRHLCQHDLDSQSYRIKYGIPKTQSLASKATTARRKEIVEESRPWEKTATYQKAQGGTGTGVKKTANPTKSSAKPKSSAKRAGAKSA